jgi:hypothetical protein
MPRPIFIFFTFFLLFGQALLAQRCGTKVTKEQVKFEQDQAAMRYAASVKPIHCLNKTLSMFIHIVLDSLNNGNVTQLEINDALAVVNKDFEPICLNFTICKQDTIRNFQFDSILDPREAYEITHLYNVPNVINVYLVTAIFSPSTPEVGGLASFTGDWVMVCKGISLTGEKAWSHEMGHFFSLYHTFEDAFGAELVDGSNCDIAGDLLCDTEADVPNPAFTFGSTPNICIYMDTSLDAMGNQYTPIVGNIMSYHPAQCKTPFTVQQLNRMSAYYLSYRNYLH